MNSVKYVGFDVHQSTLSIAVLNAEGELVMQSVPATTGSETPRLKSAPRKEQALSSCHAHHSVFPQLWSGYLKPLLNGVKSIQSAAGIRVPSRLTGSSSRRKYGTTQPVQHAQENGR
jgi:hypothetical protein